MTILRRIVTLLECDGCGDVVGVIPMSADIVEAQKQLTHAERHVCLVLA